MHPHDNPHLHRHDLRIFSLIRGSRSFKSSGLDEFLQMEWKIFSKFSFIFPSRVAISRRITLIKHLHPPKHQPQPTSQPPNPPTTHPPPTPQTAQNVNPHVQTTTNNNPITEAPVDPTPAPIGLVKLGAETRLVVLPERLLRRYYKP